MKSSNIKSEHKESESFKKYFRVQKFQKQNKKKRANRLKSHYYQTRGTKNKFSTKKTSELFCLMYVKKICFLPEQIH